MKRALSASEHMDPSTKPHSATSKTSTPVDQKITAVAPEESLKKELLKSDAKIESAIPDPVHKKGSSTTSSPLKMQHTAVPTATKVAKEAKGEAQAGPASSQKTPLDNQGPATVQKNKLGLEHSKVMPDAQKESAKSPGPSGPKTGPDVSKTTESLGGKMFGFGSSIFSSASSLISSSVQDESKITPPSSRKMSAPAQVSPKMSAVSKIYPKSTPTVSPKMSPAREPKTVPHKPEQEKKPDESQNNKQPSKEAAVSQTGAAADKTICPLCKAEMNIGSRNPPNYNTCTECKTVVCNQCGFNPIPIGEVSTHLVIRS